MSPGPFEGPRLGPKAAEDEDPATRPAQARGLPLRGLLPNAITAAALCSGLTGIRFAISGNWREAVFAIILAGLLDGIDGRIARLLKAQSRFGAELDSLSDSLSFGTAPAIVIYLWSLSLSPRLGWFAALAFAVCCALRLARFNAQIDVDEQPHKSAGFLTGIPAPGRGGACVPAVLSMGSHQPDGLPQPIAGRHLDRADRPAHDLKPRDAQLGIVAAQAQHPPVADCLRRNDVRRAAAGAMVDARGDLLRLSGARALQPRSIREGQAAARVQPDDLISAGEKLAMRDATDACAGRTAARDLILSPETA